MRNGRNGLLRGLRTAPKPQQLFDASLYSCQPVANRQAARNDWTEAFLSLTCARFNRERMSARQRFRHSR
jgi:hypothetical protein